MENFLTSFLSDINEARTNPQKSAEKYRTSLLPHYNDQLLSHFGKRIQTFEGTEALKDYYQFANKCQSVQHLLLDPTLSAVAQMIAQEKGNSGRVDHEQPDKIAQRIMARTKIGGKVAELIGLGTQSGEQLATYFLIDDGLISRRRRKILMDSGYGYIGLGFAQHKTHGTIAVVLLAQTIFKQERIESTKLI